MTLTVVTGSSTGIGYATALRLAADGHHVVATMRNPDTCDIAAVAKERGLDLETRTLDVNEDASVDALFASVGEVDVLVNNAGLGTGGVFEEMSLDLFRSIMETNYFGALRCMKAVVPSMRERGAGTIVNVTSQAGRLAMPCMGAYVASKFALEAASESLWGEVSKFGIRVHLIEPGAIMTAIWGKQDMTPPTGPYAPALKRLTKTVMAELAHASSADEVADCIAEAITTDEPRLRWLTGQGAERNIANRAAMTDEEANRLWNTDDNDAFMARMFAEPE